MPPPHVYAAPMSEARVKAGLWVAAALRAADVALCPGMVLRRGDPDAGGILLVLRGRAGLAVLSQIRTGEGESAWLRATGAAAIDQAAADAYVARQLRVDPDLWVVEFETPDLRLPLPLRIIER
jgi:hypothetical protein